MTDQMLKRSLNCFFISTCGSSSLHLALDVFAVLCALSLIPDQLPHTLHPPLPPMLVVVFLLFLLVFFFLLLVFLFLILLLYPLLNRLLHPPLIVLLLLSFLLLLILLFLFFFLLFHLHLPFLPSFLCSVCWQRLAALASC